MARMKRGAKSQAVRDYLSANPDANPKAVVEGLKEKGVKVKVTLVNSIKYGKRSKSAKKRARTSGKARRFGGAGVTVEQLIEVKRLSDSLGGADHVRSALDALEQLQ